MHFNKCIMQQKNWKLNLNNTGAYIMTSERSENNE